jgi:hypothetical protein
MGLYSNFSDKIAASVVQAEGRTQIDGGEIRLAESETVRISSDSFSQTVSPINQRTINASLRRLISPYRTVYNLMGQGTKSVSDPSSMGLSLWAKSLVESKIYLLDLHWPGPQLPPEAAAANALVLAGPRSPLGEEREKALIDYLKSGGRLFILHDPLVAALDSSMLESLGLSMPLGLVVDPDSAWAGTNDFFIVSRDFPAHPLTMGLKRPVVFPLAGAIFPVKGGTNTHEDKNEKEASQSNENTFSSRLSGHSWAVARTSDVAWLETDRSSIADNSFRYQKDQDILGPLTLASATSLTSGGRLIFTADADLAANGFIVFGGNLEFLNNSIFWLLEAQEDLATRSSGAWLDIDRFKARILFWVPTVFWPGLCLSLWLTFYYRRRRHVG